MKTQLIMLDTPIIVSDEKIKEGDFCWNTYNNIYEVVTEHEVKTANYYIKSGDVFKIIAGIEGLPSINWNGLEEEFGWVDVEKLFLSYQSTYNEVSKSSFKAIFKLAQSLNEKRFSLEDMEKAIEMAQQESWDKGYLSLEYEPDYILNLIQQPKVFDIEVKMHRPNEAYQISEHWSPKITNNSIKILRKL